jgi:hypothetical protein
MILVLVLIALFAFAGLAIAGLTNTAAAVTNGIAASNAQIRELDGVLDRAVQELRLDPDNAGASPSTPCASYTFSAATADLDVACVVPGTLSSACPTSPSAGCRDEIIEVTRHGTSDIVAQARIVVHDQVSGVDQVGYSLDVCDWQVADVVSGQPNSC